MFDLIYRTQPNPYLDEVFHIPQVRKYCEGNFTEVSSISSVYGKMSVFFM